MTQPLPKPNPDRAERPELDDAALVELARGSNEAAIRTLVRRYNQRLFRVARAIVRNDADAEDVVQQSYVNAFTHLGSFRGEARFSTWLTRIAVNEASGRLRARRPTAALEALDREATFSAEIIRFPLVKPAPDPEAEMSRTEIRFPPRTGGRCAAAWLSRRVRAARHRGHVHRGNGRAARPQARDRQDAAPSCPQAHARSDRDSADGTFGTLFPFDGERCVYMADRVLAALRAARTA